MKENCVGTTVKTKDSWMQTEEGLLDLKRPDAVSKGIMCNLYDKDSSSDSKRSSSSSSSNSPAVRQHDSDYAPDSSGSSSEEESSPQKTRKHTPRRIAQSPLDDSSAPPHLEPKYIVFESKLFELLKSCPSCGSKNVSVQKSVKGTFLKVRLECWSCNKMMRTWESQPFIQSRPAGNVLLSAAILFAGGSSTETLQILNSIKVQTMGARTFYRHQDEFLHPIIERRWRLHQEALLSKLVEVGTPLILGGDGRADSPGHSAKYGLYSGLELTISQIVDIQLVQSNEVKSSYHMELEGYQRMHSYLTSKGLTIGKLVTDRHRQLAKHVREATPEICHMYDVWHVAKGVQKKVHALAKRKEGEVVAQWVQSITNHVYWVAASTKDEEEDLRVAKWSSLRNHIRGIHHGHSDIFPSCLHEDYGDRRKKWLRPGTAACEKLDDILTSPMLVKDIRKLSSGEQTSSLESFHATLNHFAPKLKAYSYYGMISRIQLAAMHFNENSKKQQATTSTGKKRFKLSKPKYKPGRASVKPVKESSSFSYVDDLLADVAMGNRLSWQGMRRKAAPPPLSSKHTYESKDELIKQHYSRFKQVPE
ncbi:uncharacterized protein [Diadema antillarum]|uniref:uncharacterized protein n=1 Tax=Diadema antillarum TaxID=105358 RepID=UPI003A885D3B